MKLIVEEAEHEVVSDVLSTVALITLEPGDLTTAPPPAGALRSADAIHLAGALRVDAAEVLACDRALNAAATAPGLRVSRLGVRSA